LERKKRKKFIQKFIQKNSCPTTTSSS
jgi:hypothetical protein